MARKKSNRPARKGSTIYFAPDVLKRAKIYGIVHDRELSEIVETAVIEYLDGKGAPELPADASDD